ncbi:methyltransferase [Pseudonocardia nigra]|uniref:methyltransferase n=1 Tax=Pseudonocardia nigra TaxID=1921578 RepID=UPI001C5F310B|nr:methyltransferase [Pseudonocardia nigra]
MHDTPPPEFVELLDVVRGYQRSRALTVAAELGIADLLADGPRPADDLAAATGTHAPTLYRVLRALASIGVFSEDADRRFALTAMGEYLRRDHPLSVDPAARMFGAEYEWRAWGELAHSVRTGETAAVHALGTDVWEYRRRHPEHGEIFDATMRTFSRADNAGLLAAHDFGRYGTVADIGGGTGAVLAAVLSAHPATRGILFDQEQVVADAGPVLRRAGVADRVDVVPGDFFDTIPEGADAYLLVRILHDWMDEEAARILRGVRAAMAPGARVLVVDAVVGPPNEDPAAKSLDLMMLVSVGGRERTEAEWTTLLTAAGLDLVAVTRATPNKHVIEAVRV